MAKLKYFIIGIIGFIAWRLVRVPLGTDTFYKADLYLAILVFGIITTPAMMDAIRYKTPQFVANNLHFSISSPPVRIGEWALIRGGGIRYPFHMEGNEAVAIVPYDSLVFCGENIYTNVFVGKKPSRYLPHLILDHIYHNAIPSPYFLGYHPQNAPTKLIDLSATHMQDQATINELKNHLDNRAGWAEDLFGRASNIQKSFEKRKLLPFRKEKDE